MTQSSGPEPEPSVPPDVRDRPRQEQQDFVRLLVKHERQLEGFILALVPNWSAADDIAQETKLRLWEQFDQFRSGHDFGAWARTIAYYQVLSYRTRSKRLRERPFSEQFMQSLAEEESSRQDETGLRERFLASCMEKLSEKSRALLRLVYSGRRTIRQIARQLDRSEAATYKAVQTIRLWLHKCVEEEVRKEDLR
jgi:RNA polymerase sigma-70 factor, ECF subfamily